MTQDPKQNTDLTVKAELLQNVLEAELTQDTTYPWAPSEAYFTALEQAAPELEVRPGESEAFFAKLEGLWEADTAKLNNVSALLQRLSARAIQMPQNVVEAIASRATQLVDSPLSSIDQLVNCVQDSLPQWDVEDLQVMARPYAYAMRGKEPELPEEKDWEALSEMEQGRLAMAIARWILTEQENRN